MGKWRYGVVMDAGSSGTRIHIYKWLNPTRARKDAIAKNLQSLPVLKTKKEWTKKIHPGVSTFGDKPDLVGPDHLAPLLAHALDKIPSYEVDNTPIFLLATAGMRLLPDTQRTALLNEICTYARANTKFQLPDCDLHIQVITGDTEGLYGWIAANYLLGGFDNPEDHAHGKGHHTYGFLDMGGASAQIAFAPNATEAEKHANDLTLLRMRRVNGESVEYKVFVTTWLGFGVNEARRRYVQALLDATGNLTHGEIPDPCLPTGLTVKKSGAVILPGSEEAKGQEPYLVGTGKFAECLSQTYPLLEKNAPCEDSPCLLNGVHVPAIDFDVNHFVGVSEYWHTTHEIFEMSHKDKSYDFHTYQRRVMEFCSQDWNTVEEGINSRKWGKKVDETTAVEVCFKASWLINMLHEGIGIPRVGLEDTGGTGHNGTKEVLDHAKEKGFLDPFQAVDKIGDTEVSWTLGKMVLYASSQIPAAENTLAVGFSSNVNGTPAEFQYAGGSEIPLPNDLTDDNDDDVLDTVLYSNYPRRIPGFILMVVILAVMAMFLCGRDRRISIYNKLCSLFGRGFSPSRDSRPPPKSKRRIGGKLFSVGKRQQHDYERVLEDGDAVNDFELADVDHDEDEHSDSSSVTPGRVGRSSGWATPRLKVDPATDGPGYFDNVMTHGVGLGLSPKRIMDREGVLTRLASSDRLAGSRSGSRTGSRPASSRSRTASPTRAKTPLMRQLKENVD